MIGPKFYTNGEIKQMEMNLNKSPEMKVINCTQYQADEINKIKENDSMNFPCKRMDIIQIGTRADSDAYVRQKIVQGQKAGAMVVVHRFSFPEQVKLRKKIQTIRNLIMELNSNSSVHGIMVQLPMDDKEINKIVEREIIDLIDPLKDVDCLTTTNLGKLYSGFPRFLPCTPAGIIEIFDNLNTFLGEDSDKKVFDASVAKEISKFFKFVTMSTIARSKSVNPNETIDMEKIEEMFNQDKPKFDF